MLAQSKARIESIVVDRLFGFLSYEIRAQSPEDLIILYGDNGTGKTTILNLVFHALSPRDRKGHRTFIARIPFKQLEINFARGDVVRLTRRRALPGPFTMTLEHGGRTAASHLFTVNEDGRVLDQPDRTYRPLLDALHKVQLGLFLLPDDRRIKSTLYEDEPTRRYYLRRGERVFEKARQDTVNAFVQQALTRATHWARRQALDATSQGETDTNQIYADILRTITASTQREDPRRDDITFRGQLDKARALAKRSRAFSRLGLATPLAVDDLLPDLSRATIKHTEIIGQVLSPYLRSLEARLDALEELRQALETFSDIFARFYNYKALSFDVRSGITINLQHDSSEIPPDVLSSGEKQLLLLFCNVLLARTSPSVFVIDEPELSLNIKWQRELISSLMSCVKGCDVQLLLATHSLEMIALHKRCAVKLTSAG